MGHKVLVTNQPETEAMEYAKKLNIDDITYGALPYLFGDIPLPFVYDEDEVDFERNDNPVHRYKTITKLVKQQVPILETTKIFNERTGEFDIQQRQKIVPKLEFRYRLSEPELGDQSKVEQYSVFVDTPLFEEREVEIEEQIEEELPIVEGSSS